MTPELSMLGRRFFALPGSGNALGARHPKRLKP